MKPFDGVAACGGTWAGGTVQYKGVPFEKAPPGISTWQCTELAARWFYAATGIAQPLVGYGRNVAARFHAAHPQYAVYPAPGGTATFSPAIRPGDIISMWGPPSSDRYGHVAIVTAVHVTGGQGSISLLDENDPSFRTAHITVSRGQMSFGAKGGYYYYDSFQWLSVAPQKLPAEPASPRVTSATGTSETLAWRDASDNEQSFVSQYRPVGSSSWKAGPSVGANHTSLTVTGLRTGTKYTFQVGAKNAVGTHWSAYFYGWTQALPAEPTGASASMSPASAVLRWKDNSNNETSFVTQYRSAGSSSWLAGPSAGANVTSITVTGLRPSTPYTFQVGARNSVGTHWSAYFYGTTPAQPAPPPYHAGRQVSIDRHATGGVSGHKGPANSYATGPTHPANSALWIVCYVNGQSITGPYDTTTIWDLADDGYYYTDAWLYTGTNGPAVPPCALRTVSVDKHATGGVSGHRGPGNSYAAGPVHARNTPITIACYVNGQSITGPYDTTTIWDLANDGYYYTDAWLYTGTNGPAVPHC